VAFCTFLRDLSELVGLMKFVTKCFRQRNSTILPEPKTCFCKFLP
jgi:hypothetical protein